MRESRSLQLVRIECLTIPTGLIVYDSICSHLFIGVFSFLNFLSFFLSFFFFFAFLGVHLQHMEVSRLGVESELQLPAYTTATATRDPSRICNLHHRSRQLQIPNPLNKARDQIYVLMGTNRVCVCCATTRTVCPRPVLLGLESLGELV